MAPPIYVKGGLWTNVEDQILRAAVSKYGLTQWARVASLLPKKTAKQAKARWNEYLNPTINRTEWSKEEDEKLLGLAKLLPNQWRSIAPIMGRTATQCVERYQKLLESALRDGDSDEEDDELKLSGPGIEALPALGNAFESLPSRPDLEDMDEDEREMLSEAKARLANTHGKKAKRKERERMLDESKRISLLQKRRELKAAGMNVSLELKNKKRRKEFDYNADIPHEHLPPPGLFETTEEDFTNDIEKARFEKQVNLKGISVKEVDDKIKKSNEEATKKASKQLIKEILGAAKIYSQLDELQEAKRRKLDLPAPGDHSQETDNIKERILSKSKEILAGQDLKSTLSSQQAPATETVQSAHVSAPKRISRRKLADFLKSTFAELPKPQNTVQVVLPLVDPNEEEITLQLERTLESQLQNLLILQQVEEEKEKLRRSQVVQRGLKIPHPNLLKTVNLHSLPEIDRLIANEVRALVKSDYTQFEDPSYGAMIVDTLDEEALNRVNAAILEETKRMKSIELPEIEFVLPKTQEAIDQAIDTLDELDGKADEADQTAKDKHEYKDYVKQVEAKFNNISALAEELGEKDSHQTIFAEILQKELAAIGMRSGRLHELVDSVTAAAARVSR